MPVEVPTIIQEFIQGGLLFKGAFVTLTVFFTLFTLVVFNQVRTMEKTVHTQSANLVLFFSLVIVVSAISLFLLSLAIL